MEWQSTPPRHRWQRRHRCHLPKQQQQQPQQLRQRQLRLSQLGVLG
jgi:hypothetical protein